MIKAIIFDYGGVIIAGGGANGPAEDVAATLGISIEEATKITSIIWHDYVAGKSSEEQYWQRIEQEYGKPITVDIPSTRSTWEEVAPLPEMVSFIKDLKAKGYTVGLMSNITPTTEAVIRAGGGYDLFDPCVLSCRIGYAKPSLEIYNELLEQLSTLKPDEIIFIDDQQRYLDPADSLGIKTVLAKSSEQIIRDVKRLL